MRRILRVMLVAALCGCASGAQTTDAMSGGDTLQPYSQGGMPGEDE